MWIARRHAATRNTVAALLSAFALAPLSAWAESGQNLILPLVTAIAVASAASKVPQRVATMEPGASSGPRAMEHPGEELVFMLEGSIRFVIDGEEQCVGPGDAPVGGRRGRLAGRQRVRSAPRGMDLVR